MISILASFPAKHFTLPSLPHVRLQNNSESGQCHSAPVFGGTYARCPIALGGSQSPQSLHPAPLRPSHSLRSIIPTRRLTLGRAKIEAVPVFFTGIGFSRILNRFTKRRAVSSASFSPASLALQRHKSQLTH